MKFWQLTEGSSVERSGVGLWVQRADAEQAVKDAVEMANDVLGQVSRLELWDKAQAIIDKYEGGQHD